MSLYEFLDYKQALRSVMEDRRKRFGSRFTFEKMAVACGVQKTYLSKVLNSSAHLNQDQLFAAVEYLNLEPSDYEYLSLLRESQSGLNSKRLKMIQEKINQIRKSKLKTEAVINIDPDQSIENLQWEYYTDIELQLVHMFLTVNTYSREPLRIISKIGIDELKLQNILLKLQRWKLIKYDGQKYLCSDPMRHLAEDSPVFKTFAILMRLKTIENIHLKNVTHNLDYFFSVMFSANPKIQEKLKKNLLNFIKETQKEVVTSKSEEVYQLNIDFFKWS